MIRNRFSEVEFQKLFWENFFGHFKNVHFSFPFSSLEKNLLLKITTTSYSKLFTAFMITSNINYYLQHNYFEGIDKHIWILSISLSVLS
jgi:hypothetical protein